METFFLKQLGKYLFPLVFIVSVLLLLLRFLDIYSLLFLCSSGEFLSISMEMQETFFTFFN